MRAVVTLLIQIFIFGMFLTLGIVLAFQDESIDETEIQIEEINNQIRILEHKIDNTLILEEKMEWINK